MDISPESLWFPHQFADVDGDAVVDLLEKNLFSWRFWRGDGAGGFSAASQSWYLPGSNSGPADIDNDGRLDLFGSRHHHAHIGSPWLVLDRNSGSYAAEDRAPPSLDLQLLPVIDDERTPPVFGDRWRVQTLVEDDCDALPQVDYRMLALTPIPAGTPTLFRVDEASEIRVWKEPSSGLVQVLLLGSVETDARARWTEITAAGGFALEANQIAQMLVVPVYGATPAAMEDDGLIPVAYRLAARYVLSGPRLERAAATEPGADIIVRVGISDRAGHSVAAEASLGAERDRYCEEAQAAEIVCR